MYSYLQIFPGRCEKPRLHGKPKSNNLSLRWGFPDYDGGAQVQEFQVDMTAPDNRTRSVYKGRETECVVASLLPGRPYLFQVRAYNRAGAGPWSESLEVVSGAGCPGQPKEPRLDFVVRETKGQQQKQVAVLTWEAPINNGAVITEYQLQCAVIARTVCQRIGKGDLVDDDEENEEDDNLEVVNDEDSDAELDDEDDDESDSDDEDDSEDGQSQREELDDQDEEEDDDAKRSESPDALELVEVPAASVEWSQLYRGERVRAECDTLEAAARYKFRLRALNSAGASEWSEEAEASTPPAAPDAVAPQPQLTAATSSSLTLSWSRPQCNGRLITHYEVECAENKTVTPTSGPETFLTLDDLRPDTAYNLKVRAVNDVGAGAYGDAARLRTRPLPPAPPRLECANANHNSLKLRWAAHPASPSVNMSSSGDAPSGYVLEMENSRGQFQSVYNGPAPSHKVNKLSENTRYRFRVCASNQAGMGPFSKVHDFATAYALPPPMKSKFVHKSFVALVPTYLSNCCCYCDRCPTCEQHH